MFLAPRDRFSASSRSCCSSSQSSWSFSRPQIAQTASVRRDILKSIHHGLKPSKLRMCNSLDLPPPRRPPSPRRTRGRVRSGSLTWSLQSGGRYPRWPQEEERKAQTTSLTLTVATNCQRLLERNYVIRTGRNRQKAAPLIFPHSYGLRGRKQPRTSLSTGWTMILGSLKDQRGLNPVSRAQIASICAECPHFSI